MRPGTYAVHVLSTQGTIIDDSATGEVVGTVTVAPGPNALGTLTWSPPFHAKLLWSIGTSDRRSGEFRFSPSVAAGPGNVAGATGRTYGPSATAGMWTVPPANLTYTIGSSTPAADWYFAQSVTGTWTVDFTLASVPPGGAFLTLGIAGAARNPHLNVAVNGHALVSHGFGNDQSLYRSALVGGFFETLTATVPAADLQVGANAVTLQLTNGSGGTGLYYDVLKLESD